MKNKLFSLSILGIFAFLLLTSFSSSLSISGNDFGSSNSTTITITTNATESGSVSLSFSSDLSIVPINSFAMNNGTSASKTISFTEDIDDLDFGKTYSTIVTASLNGITASKTLNFNKDFYTGENKGKLKISDLEFNVDEGFGDDEDYWYPLDSIEISFTIENNGDYDISNIAIESCLLDKVKEECIMDEGDMEIDKDDFDLDSDDDQDVIITFKVDPDKLKAGNNQYAFYVRAVGEIDDSSADELDGDETGISDYKPIEIITDDEFVIIDDAKLEPASVSCGQESVVLTADVWNVGKKDLDDDEIFVLIYNKDLGLSKLVGFDSGLDAMDSQKIQVQIDLPEEFSKKYYNIELTAYKDDSLDDDEIFATDKEDDQSTYLVPLQIVNTSCSLIPKASVSAKLESEKAIAGQDLIVKFIVSNLNSKTTTFNLGVSGYQLWASSAELDKTSLTLGAGESEEVLATLKLNEDSTGTQNFSLLVKEGDKSLSQQVSIEIENKQSEGFFNAILSNVKQGNTYIWVIGALNVLLIVLIIVFSVKLSKKKK